MWISKKEYEKLNNKQGLLIGNNGKEYDGSYEDREYLMNLCGHGKIFSEINGLENVGILIGSKHPLYKKVNELADEYKKDEEAHIIEDN